MVSSPRERRRERYQRRLELHWGRLLYMQIAAYIVVLAIWAVPIPNPIKLLAVTFHEVSHALVAVLTGGRLFGFAIDPAGAGVTMGIGGNMTLILIAGYIGSSLWGVALYRISVMWDTRYALLTLVFFLIGSAMLGWLTEQTAFFGLGSLALLVALYKAPVWAQQFAIQLAGSACCLYAPLELLSEVARYGLAPSVLGMETQSDIAQLAALWNVPRVVIGLAILALQLALLVYLVRWTCSTGARAAAHAKRDDTKLRRQLMADLHPERKRYVIR
jgi:hypothetical protein